MACFSQWSGNSVSSYYLPAALENAGITSESQRLLLNAINSPLCFVAAITGSFLVDKAGRRPMLMGTLCRHHVLPRYHHAHIQARCGQPRQLRRWQCHYCLHLLVRYNLFVCLDTDGAHVRCRVSGYERSAKGKSVAQFVTAASSAIIQYSSGPAFQHIHYYFYCVFIAWNCIELLAIYFAWPETAGRTLEELSEVFSAPNPVKKSLQAKDMQTVFNTMHADVIDSKMEV